MCLLKTIIISANYKTSLSWIFSTTMTDVFFLSFNNNVTFSIIFRTAVFSARTSGGFVLATSGVASRNRVARAPVKLLLVRPIHGF